MTERFLFCMGHAMPETIETQCLECNGRFAVPKATAGKKIRCPKCQGIISVAGPSPLPQAQQTAKPQASSATATRRQKPPANKPTSASHKRTPKLNTPNRPVASGGPSRTPSPKPRPVKPKSTRNARPRPAHPDDEFDDEYDEYDDFDSATPRGSRYSEPATQMPGRRKKQKREPLKPALKGSADDNSLSYNGQRMVSIGISLLLMAAGAAWAYAQMHYGSGGRIRLYPYFLIGGGFMNIARAILDD
ncbi:MAG: hypothetical protein ABJZ55_25850 [Fuerstiella sp.]